MIKTVLSAAAIIAVGWYFWTQTDVLEFGGTTRGDVADMNAADEVARCARQYSEAAMWRQCLDIVAESTARRPDSIARHVNRQEGRTIFAVAD